MKRHPFHPLCCFILYFVCSFLPVEVPAQITVSFPTANAEWVVKSNQPLIGADDLYYVWKYRLNGDTLIDAKEYAKVYVQTLCWSNTNENQYKPADPSYLALAGAIRVDSQRVLFRRFKYKTSHFSLYGSQAHKFPENTDNVLYDFTLEKGDTIVYAGNGEKLTVIKVSFDQGKKVIDLRSSTTPFQPRWVEGIGCTKGLFETTLYWFDWGSCLHVEGQTPACPVPCIPPNPVLVADSEAPAPGDFSIWPSPASDYVDVDFDVMKQPIGLDIFSPDGRLLASYPEVNPGQRIPLHNLNKGLLIFRLMNRAGENVFVKVLKM